MGKKHKKKKKRTAGPARSHSQPPVSIALCMIVKNEERFLPGCLDSVRGLVDEIVIVDTGSSDRTIEIAEKYTSEIFHFEWKNDFAAARNFALDQCRSSWILYLDADERLPAEYHSELRKEIERNSADACYLKIYSRVNGILGDVPNVQMYPRLFKKLEGVRFEGQIHEQITPALKRVHAKMVNLDVTIEHLGYAQDDEVLSAKIQRNLEYLESQVRGEPENAYARFQLGQTLLLADKIAQGMQVLQKALDLGTLPVNLTATTYLMLANEHFRREDFDAALEYIEKAVSLAPRQRLGYFLASECLARKQKWDEAAGALRKLRAHENLTFSEISIEKFFKNYLISQRMGLYLFHLADYKAATVELEDYFLSAADFRYHLLEKWAYAVQQGNGEPARLSEMLSYFETRIDLFDEPENAATLLGGMAEKYGFRQLLKRYMEICLRLNPVNEMALYYLGNLHLQQKEYRQADGFFFEALKLNNTVWEVHYNLAVSKIKQIRFTEAIAVLEKAVEIFPEKKEKVNRLLGGLYAKTGQFDKIQEVVNTN